MTGRHPRVGRKQKARATCRNRGLLTESLTGAEVESFLKRVVFGELIVPVGRLHQILFENKGENRPGERSHRGIGNLVVVDTVIGLENHRLSTDGGCNYQNNAENDESILTHGGSPILSSGGSW